MKKGSFAPAVTVALAVLACSTPSFAAVPPALAAQARAAIDADTPRLTAMFKDIHQNPEVGFMETRTAAIVAKELKALGFTVTTGIGGTGVVGVLRNGDGPVVMYRADDDKKGSIEVGKLADLAILSADPTAVNPETLDQLKVTETIKEGKTIFTRAPDAKR